VGLLEQLREIAYRENWRVELSDKGIYASESAQLFGGFRELDEALREGPTRRILDCYVKDDDVGLLLRSDRRRYLSLTELPRPRSGCSRRGFARRLARRQTRPHAWLSPQM
jgi:hypothetical protein